MRNILLDTHLFLWMQFDSAQLPKQINRLMQSDDVCWHLSQVSVWEIQIKFDLQKLPLPKPPQALLPNLIEESGLNFQPLQNEAIFMLGKLPPIHRDPFDRLLITTAIVNGWEIATVDGTFQDYPVRIVL